MYFVKKRLDKPQGVGMTEGVSEEINCENVDRVLANNPSRGGVLEMFQRMKKAQKHIHDCPTCRQKYDTLDTVVSNHFEKKDKQA